MSFAWIRRPGTGVPFFRFAIGSDQRIETFRVDYTGPLPATPTITQQAYKEIAPPDIQFGAVKNGDFITALDCATLNAGGGGGTTALVYASSKGRIYVCDANSVDSSGQLLSLRTSAQEVGTPIPSASPTTWPSNRTLAQTPACDLVQGASGKGDFYFAEFANPAVFDGASRYRLGKIGIGNGPGGANGWTPWVSTIESGPEWDLYHPNWTRSLQVENFDGDVDLEAKVFTETGVAFYDGDHDAFREFQTSSYAPNWMGDGTEFSGAGVFKGFESSHQQIVSFTQGGRVFERLASREVGDYWYLGHFTPPPDPGPGAWPFAQFGAPTAAGWWYPRVNSNAIMDGQIASNMQSAYQLSLGTSMKVAMVRDHEMQLKPHLVVGTSGGYVYVIDPTDVPPVTDDVVGRRVSKLRCQSTYMGTYIVGLDVGNLDDDPDEEIVCGNWIDQGTFVDWDGPSGPDLTKNRANLYILDPVAGGTMAAMTAIVLNGDDLMTAGKGIGSGVTGVKIDDVDGDGHKEIWCSDAAGHIYLFQEDATGWHCMYRSECFGTYPGFYNNLHPIKSSAPGTVLLTVTTKLVVQSPGYTMLFDVLAGSGSP